MNLPAYNLNTSDTNLSSHSRKRIQSLFYRVSGIHLADTKEQLIINRLYSHMTSLGFKNFDDYCDHIETRDNEKDRLTTIDLLTTNETYFFREPEHFKLLRNQIFPEIDQRPVRIWCAAASSGEEPYSIAMELMEYFGASQWELIASDISYRMLEKARAGLYPMQRLDCMPNQYLHKYCRKGVGNYQGMIRVNEQLRKSVHFIQHNLLNPADSLGQFDVIFVRNVMIYFDEPVKHRVLRNLCRQLKPGGYLITSHSESIIGKSSLIYPEKPSVYRRLTDD